jgi:hypothetical protein
MWLVYSMNKEDIWVSSVSVPVTSTENQEVTDVFNEMKPGEELNRWNIYSPVWAPARIEKDGENVRYLVLRDKDRYDFSKAERVFKTSKKIKIDFNIKPMQDNGLLYIEIHDRKGEAAVTMLFDEQGRLSISNKQGMNGFGTYKPGVFNNVELNIDSEGFYSVSFNGKELTNLRLSSFYLEPLERIVFRTGPRRTFPDASPDNLQMDGPEFRDLPFAGEPEKESIFMIGKLVVKSDW